MKHLLLSVFLVVGLDTFSQSWTFPVSGRVTNGGKKLDRAIVTLLKSGSQANQVVTSSNGKFEFVLEPNADYIITVTKPGFITKKFSFNTQNVPPDRAKQGFGGVDLSEIVIFEIPKGVDVNELNNILSQPIAKFAYQDAGRDFNYDENYTRSIRTKLDKLADVQKKAEEEDKKKSEGDKAATEKFNSAVGKADKAFASKDYAAAKAAYNEALSLKPAEAAIKSKLTEIDNLIAKEAIDKANAAKEKELNVKYTAAITKADQALAAKDYNGAKAGYTEALGLKSTEKYPKDKLTEIDKILADIAAKEAIDKANAAKEKELNAKYTAAITKADQALAAKDYNGAKAGYTEALGLKSTEKYPKDKLGEIDKTLADITAKEASEKANAAKEKELNAKYTAAITKADQALAAKDYNGAKAGYTEALGLKSTEKYPKDKLTEIDKILADIAAKEASEKANAAKEKELNAKYTAAITKADQALAANDYNGAKAGYTEALGLKPAEKYPKDKLGEIDRILAGKEAADKANAAKEKELNAKYTAAIARADKSFAANDLVSAKSGYSEASGLKPAEKYPQDKLAEIEKILSEKAAKAANEKERAAKEKELNDKYAAAIAKGDKAFTTKDYLGAKTAFNEAATLKLNEEYPKAKLNEIEKLLREAANKEASEKEKAAREKEINEKYTLAMTRGNKSLTAKDYEGAKTAYNEALTLKPLEQLPKDKLAEIQRLLQAAEADKASAVKEKELNDKYNAVIASADKAFSARDYTLARTGYTTGLTLKSAEKYPQDKLAEIEKILADIAGKESAQKEKKAKEEEINAGYNTAIAKADKAFASKAYGSAQALYSEASGIKPAEKYPKDRMIEIERLLDEQSAKDADKAKQEKYKALIDKADRQFNGKEYKAARIIYQEASGVRSSEKYPKDKILEIDGILNKLKAVTTGTSVVSAAIVPPKDNDPVKKQEYVNALVLKYPQGVTEEQFQEGNCKILKRVVVKGNNAATYKKSMWAWGGVFYFKDDMSITEAAFNSETQ
ncbi:MAG: hypothetical protein HYU69_16410 [Bacteroidetes bacterium]|nr:hypothetical protein [Bacteroidota bacterium]